MDPLRYPDDHSAHLTRRRVLQYGAAAAALGAVAPWQAAHGATPRLPRVREAGALHYPRRPVGKFTGAFPFDHIVLVMQENHSFDNYLGMLPVSGQPKADGFTFNKRDEPVNWNPIGKERMYAYHQAGAIGSSDTGSQNWNDSHQQIAHGAMNGFAETGPGSMGYYTEDDLPFYYSLAKTFTLANRWFCSVPAQTYPNRRFFMAATATGVISTDLDTVTRYPRNGTIWDQLSRHNIPWANYFSDAPTTAIISGTLLRHAANLRRIEQFYVDAAAGNLPAVSLVDCNMGAIQTQVSGVVEDLPAPIPTFTRLPDTAVDITCESEENPEDVQLGEAFVARIVNAVMHGPKWRRTLLIWLYDEHGGYYDHVPPPRAVTPDGWKPDLGTDHVPGGYNRYGPRVPAVVVSPYARKRAVTNLVHDHTSVLATIEKQWNLPALTRRDANARTLADFLDTSKPAFLEPPTLAKPANPLPGLLTGYQHGHPVPPAPGKTKPKGGPKPK
ncbi:MAG TPA: alkaline phosphatase family protein [Mycobacteriales bacterium]|nr:alkaline phosphatase family protein [Mycobacteriales bacterium]